MSKKSPKQEDVHIGNRVRLRRMMLGMSQELLADKLGVSFQQVQKYEKGTNRIGGSRMVEIGKALQATPAFFYEGIEGDGETSNEMIALASKSRAAMTLLQIFSDLDTQGQQAILKVAETISDARKELPSEVPVGKNAA